MAYCLIHCLLIAFIAISGVTDAKLPTGMIGGSAFPGNPVNTGEHAVSKSAHDLWLDARQSDESSGLGSKFGEWFANEDNKNFLLEAGLGVLPYVMEMLKKDEEPVDHGGGGGGYRPPVATGGPGYGGGGGGGQYGLSWSFGQPQGGSGGGYKPGRV